jgi:hypothetical protein
MTKEFIIKRYKEQDQYLTELASRTDISEERKKEISDSAYQQLFYFMDLKFEIIRKESDNFAHRFTRFFGGTYYYKDMRFDYPKLGGNIPVLKFKVKRWFSLKMLGIEILLLKIKIWFLKL